MITLVINGLPVRVEEGTTLLEAAKFIGFPIPTLCHLEGLSPYGACRLCVVEIGEGPKAKLVSSCTYPAEEGLKVRTASARVVRARKMILELLLASCPQSKTIQDLAAAHEVRQQRFRQEYEDCILCGLCVRMCAAQMMANAIGFRGRGEHRSIGTPFDIKSERCRLCGGCMYICPACQLRCTYTEPEKAICGACANLSPPCLLKKQFDDMMCYMEPCVACEIK
ncbi:MAG: 2Fe-2S iron-sulfur cluster-binding protein [candidate division KSB1 bacterium]|nr:2Fe-2S iron-sulfur cluster-binding protein [candidate division KSB1 bacterium]MDZ7303348.1 2Fe-2S iron-sulfur cluster-binding protein [candidate division KSB1 bacterium]MDZ7310402.1 2Fe-2S iron-sulfur cluster-binding protein [candidate division KSB1 bacterium]